MNLYIEFIVKANCNILSPQDTTINGTRTGILKDLKDRWYIIS